MSKILSTEILFIKNTNDPEKDILQSDQEVTNEETCGIWDSVNNELEIRREKIENYILSQKKDEPEAPFLDTEVDYLDREVFPYLMPALEKVLFAFQETCLDFEKVETVDSKYAVAENTSKASYSRTISDINENSCITLLKTEQFNGILELSKSLWKNNPKYPNRNEDWQDIEDFLTKKTSETSISSENIEDSEDVI